MKLPLLFVTAAMLAQGVGSPWVERLAFWARGDLRRMQKRLGELETTLAALPEMTLINSNLRIGLKTGYTTEEEVRWVDLTLPHEAQADSVVLVPPLAKAATAVVAGYGFPTRFKLEVFNQADQGQTVLDHTQADFANPGCYPVIARFASRPVKRVRLTATEPWSRDGPEVLAMAEMLILSGNRNLAIEARVTSSSSRNAPRAWTRANVVDMITPLGLPVAPQSGGTLGFHSAVATQAESPKSLTLTLPKVMPIDEVRLVPVRRREVPLWFDYGFPVRFRVEIATQADFSDAEVLQEVTDRLQPTPGMNLVCLPGRGQSARYVRLITQELWERKNEFILALAEFQVLSQGSNMAPQGQFSASDQLDGDPAWSLAALADGWVENGRLMELPDWFAQLQQRQGLEEEREQLLTAQAARLEQAKQTLVNASVGSVGVITLLSSLLLWRQHRRRLEDARRLQEKLARDLHDEIGSNLGSIRLICSMATQPDVTLNSLRSDLGDIERVAAESADSMRDMVQLIHPTRTDGAERPWLEVLQGLTERLLRGHQLDCRLPSAPLTAEPDAGTRRELYLFCKEVLHNIARHAQASQVRFHLSPIPGGLRLEIRDNGRGFDPEQVGSGHGLGNLRQRAASLKAELRLTAQPGQGTCIELDVPQTKHWHAL